MSGDAQDSRLSRRGLLREITAGWLAALLGTRGVWPQGLAAETRQSPAQQPVRSGKSEAASRGVKTVLGIGAHYDDCVFGIPGTLLKAVKKNYRVVVLSLIGDYSNWRPAKGHERDVVEGTIQLGKEYGVEMRFLSFAGMKFEVSEANQRLVAEAVADVAPDIAFLLWPHDHHPDHEVASPLSQAALRHADRLIDGGGRFRPPQRLYYYDNGPRHTIGFEPDTFIDVTGEWPDAIQWLGKLMAMVRREPFDPAVLDGAQRAKETLARYRGQTCGVQYAEAVRGVNVYPREVF